MERLNMNTFYASQLYSSSLMKKTQSFMPTFQLCISISIYQIIKDIINYLRKDSLKFDILSIKFVVTIKNIRFLLFKYQDSLKTKFFYKTWSIRNFAIFYYRSEVTPLPYFTTSRRPKFLINSYQRFNSTISIHFFFERSCTNSTTLFRKINRSFLQHILYVDLCWYRYKPLCTKKLN